MVIPTPSFKPVYYLEDFIDIIIPSNGSIVLAGEQGVSNSDEELELNINSTVAPICMVFYIDYENANITNPPQFTFLINPNNMNFSLSKKVADNFTRGGHVIEEWGENRDVIKCEGKIGAYYVINPTYTYQAGLNTYDRRKSHSFRSLYSLFILYKNNGAIFQRTPTKTVSSSKLMSNTETSSTIPSNTYPLQAQNKNNRILKLGTVYLSYDQTIYSGTFDEFNIEEDAEKPFTLSYSFQFTVAKRVVNDKRTPFYYNQSSTETQDLTQTQLSTKNLILPTIQTTNTSTTISTAEPFSVAV